jgi:hypothetical protein
MLHPRRVQVLIFRMFFAAALKYIFLCLFKLKYKQKHVDILFTI